MNNSDNYRAVDRNHRAAKLRYLYSQPDIRANRTESIAIGMCVIFVFIATVTLLAGL